MKTTPSSSTRKRAQTWSIDFTIGMLLFIFGILIALKLIINSTQSSGFALVERESQGVSDLLISEGNPADWTNDTVVTLGLTTKNALNMTKLRRLYAMDPSQARRYLHLRHDYYVFFEDKDYGIIYMNTTCGFGSEDVLRQGSIRYGTVAYYASDALGETAMMGLLGQDYNASIYIKDETPGTVLNGFTLNGSLDNLTTDLDRYDTLFLENPSFQNYSGGMNETAVAGIISEWVSRGNILFITQSAGVSIAGGSFPSSALGVGNLTTVVEHEDSGFFLGDSFIPDHKFTVTPLADALAFVKLANFTNGEIGIALWGYGEGRIFYISDAEGLLGSMTTVSDQLNYTLARLAPGFCEGLDLSHVDRKDLVKTERYVVYNDKIAKMDIYVWSDE